jgi:hypothetical protein
LNKQAVFNLLEKNKESIGLSILDIENSIITNAYKSPSSGLTFIYLQQAYNGLPIFNQLKTFVFKDEILVSNEGFRIENWNYCLRVFGSGLPLGGKPLGPPAFATAVAFLAKPASWISC